MSYPGTIRRSVGGTLVLLALASLGSTLPEESVEFGRAPAAGLRFKVTETVTSKIAGVLGIGDDAEEREFTQTTTVREAFTQTILRVEGDAIAALERVYEDAGSRITATLPGASEPQTTNLANPLAWKHIRAEFSGDETVLKVKDAERWQDADDSIRDRLPRQRLLQGKIPLPRETKKVGESWELDARALRELFSDTTRAAENRETAIDGRARFTLAELKDIGGVRCAVIPFQFEAALTAAQLPSAKYTLQGKLLYSIPHRIFYGLSGTGNIAVTGESQQMGQTLHWKLAGKIQTEFTVSVPDEERPRPEGDADDRPADR
ncbi:MAG: hypothetical protein JXQ29_06355 [Planctomycetes bacterium]|nr:hypothetical protein [Planctomycetota bacterium]